MKALYKMRVWQGNNSGNRAWVSVIAANEQEARERALQLTNFHSPRVRLDSVEEVTE